jgi:hypothetical protein
MRSASRFGKLTVLVAAPALVVTGLVTASGAPAVAATSMSTRFALNHLGSATEHSAGYDRSKFTLWVDVDGNGCDARDEVLIAEARTKPTVGTGCALTGGRWLSRYDGVITTDPSSFDIDHMVPLNEAWQSGAWQWNSATRKAYANDLGYKADLIAVSAHSNRSKGDREPQNWMPERAAYACTYEKEWVAVKWRWHLKVSAAERTYLARALSACGWPRVPRPSRPSITMRSTTTVPVPAPTPTPTATATTGLDPRFGYCYQAIAAGYGPYYRGVDTEYSWYTDADSDGVVCE